MAGSSKELLNLEKDVSAFQTSLLVCGGGRDSTASSQPKVSTSDGKLVTAPIPQSQVLGKVRDFLGVFSEANRQLEQDAKDDSKNYDIEALTGNESEVIEMDLMLGVAELRNEQALAAAEAALAGAQPSTKHDACSSESDSEDASDDDDESGSENGSDDDGSSSESDSGDSSDGDDVDDESSSLGNDTKMEDALKLRGDGSSRVVASKRRPKKQPKIIELP